MAAIATVAFEIYSHSTVYEMYKLQNFNSLCSFSSCERDYSKVKPFRINLFIESWSGDQNIQKAYDELENRNMMDLEREEDNSSCTAVLPQSVVHIIFIRIMLLFIKLTINKWGWVSYNYKEFCGSRRVGWGG